MTQLVSLKTVQQGEWLFKVSSVNDVVLVLAFCPIFAYTNMRYFVSENEASDWIQYLVLQSENLSKSEK